MATNARWRLDGYRCLVTGSTKGIGLATARELASLGARVFVTARSEEDVQRTVEQLRGEYPTTAVAGTTADLSTREGCDKLLTAVEAEWGALDCLVNNAGTNVRKPISEATYEEYVTITRINQEGVWWLCKAAQPLLMKGTRPTVVNVASAAGVQSTGSGSIYAMTKAAVIQLTKVLACEWAKHGIRVNAVAPWVTLTPLLEAAIKTNPDSLKKAASWTPLGRPGNPEEIAGAIVFLTMPASSYITGSCINADGGLNANAFDGPCNDA